MQRCLIRFRYGECRGSKVAYSQNHPCPLEVYANDATDMTVGRLLIGVLRMHFWQYPLLREVALRHRDLIHSRDSSIDCLIISIKRLVVLI